MVSVSAVLVVLLCTLVGWLVGYPLLGLVLGVVLVLLGVGVSRT